MKRIVYHNEAERVAIEYTSKIVDFGLALIIYSALNELFTAYTMLSQSSLFKHDIKRRSKAALKLRNRKLEELKNLVVHRGFTETYWDYAIDASSDDVENLRAAIQSVIDEANIPNAFLFSQVEIARILLESSKFHYEEVISASEIKFSTKTDIAMKHLNLRDIFREFNIADIFKEWDAMCNALYSESPSKVDLNDERVSEPFLVLANKFAKGEYIDECLAVASEEYPEFANSNIKKAE